MSRVSRGWQPTFPPLSGTVLDDDVSAQPDRTLDTRNGMPEHRPYRSPPEALRAETFSGACKRGKHRACRRACCCFCHG